jgi:urease subunit alpha
LGSIAPGKLADLVLWEPAFFGAKPKMVLKGGMILWSSMGDPNASLPTPQPMYYRPMFGAFGSALSKTCVTFVSRASYDNGIAEKYGLQRTVRPVYGTRTLTKRNMVRNDFLPNIDVNPQTFAVTVDGVHLTVTPPKSIALGQLYFFS